MAYDFCISSHAGAIAKQRFTFFGGGKPKKDLMYTDDAICKTALAARTQGSLAAWLASAWSRPVFRAEVILTYYKPFTCARLVAEVRLEPRQWTTPESKLIVYIHVYPTRDDARKEYALFASAGSLTSEGLTKVTFLEDIQSVVWILPDGPAFDSIDFCFRYEEFSHFISEQVPLGHNVVAELPRLIRYVPRKRAIFCYDANVGSHKSTFYIKSYPPDHDIQAARNLEILTELANQRRLAFQPPLFVHHSRRWHAVVMDEVPGMPLSDLIDTASPFLFANVGSSLASLHMSNIGATGTWPPERLLNALAEAISDTQRALPVLTDSLNTFRQQILERRRTLLFDENTPIHGNLFGDQILIDSDQVGIVDWDDLGLGDPLFDLGRLIAHFIYVSRHQKNATRIIQNVSTMLEAYRTQTRQAIVWDRLRWHIAVALVMRAKISSLRKLSITLVSDVITSLAEAQRVLHGTSAWIPQ